MKIMIKLLKKGISPDFCPPLFVEYKVGRVSKFTHHFYLLESHALDHKVHKHKEYHNHSVFSLVGIGTLPPPLWPASMPLPTEPKGGHTRLRARGWGSPNSDDWRKSLALCLLCALDAPSSPVVYIGCDWES
jgi:hypothetical protein